MALKPYKLPLICQSNEVYVRIMTKVSGPKDGSYTRNFKINPPQQKFAVIILSNYLLDPH